MKKRNNIEIKVFGAIVAACILLSGCEDNTQDNYIQQTSEIQSEECVEAAKSYVLKYCEDDNKPSIVQAYALSDMIMIQTEENGRNYMHKVYFSGKSPISDIRYELHD